MKKKSIDSIDYNNQLFDTLVQDLIILEESTVY